MIKIFALKFKLNKKQSKFERDIIFWNNDILNNLT